MNIFGYEIRKAPKPGRGDLSGSKVPQILGSGYLNSIFSTDTATYQNDLQKYRSWVYVCSSKNAIMVAKHQLKLYVKSGAGLSTRMLFPTIRPKKKTLDYLHSTKYVTQDNQDIEEVVEHPLLDLLKKVNDWNNRFDMWMLTQLYLEMVGNAYWYVVRDGLGIPQQMWVMMSQYMKVIKDKQKFIGGYEFRKGMEVVRFEPEEIIHFKFPNPTSNFYGFAPLSAIGIAVNLHSDMQNFELSLLHNNAAPEGIISTEQSLSDQEIERLANKWNEKYTGTNKAGKTPLLSRGLRYEKIGLSQRDMSFAEGRRNLREEIASAFGVPMSKLTTTDVNLANAEIGEEQYIQDTILPRLTLIEEKINEKLVPIYDENLFVAYDPISKEDKDFILRERESNLLHQVTTINEERLRLGMEAVPWGDVPLVGMGIGPLGAYTPEEDEQQLEQMALSVASRVKTKLREGIL
jgi:HK97 family phage portal protein